MQRPNLSQFTQPQTGQPADAFFGSSFEEKACFKSYYWHISQGHI
jgi:hypothetical protein